MKRCTISLVSCLLLGALLAVLSAPRVLAQDVGATLSGTVTDTSGAVLVGAEVLINNLETGVKRTVSTNDAGLFSAPALPPGLYEVTTVAPGFDPVRLEMRLTVGLRQVANVKLSPGAIAEELVVTARASEVELASPTLSHSVGETAVRELPLNGRDWTQLATLAPAVANVRVGGAGMQSGMGSKLTMAGSRPTENVYRVDGIHINDFASAGAGSALAVNLGVEAIQEFTVQTSTYSAEHGRTSGGVLNAITKSGTNALHGSAYYFHRNSALDARNFFDPPGVPRPPFARHQFGAAAGGPIRANQTFWFADYENLRESLATSRRSITLSPAARLGQLSTGVVTVDPAVVPYLAVYPLPNGPLLGAGDTGEFIFNPDQVSDEYFLVGKVDHNFSGGDRLSVSYTFNDADQESPNVYNQILRAKGSRRQRLVMEHSRIFGPAVLNSFRAGVSRVAAGDGGDASLSTVLDPIAEDTSLGFFPGRTVGHLEIPGLSLFDGGLGGIEHNIFWFMSYQVKDDVHIQRGRHSVRIGGEFEYLQDKYDANFTPNGQFQFPSIQGFLTNRPSRFVGPLPDTDTVRDMRQIVAGAYIQDDIRWLQNLTINLGLRYEMATVPTEKDGKIANLVELTDPEPTVGFLYNNNTLKNFAPRVGFAWDPFSKGRTSIRGGAGIFDVLPLSYIFRNRFTRTPPWFRTGFANLTTPGLFPTAAAALLTPSTLRTIYVEPDPARSYKYQFNLTLEQQLKERMTASIGYVGSRGRNLPTGDEDIDIVLPTRDAEGYLWPDPATSTRINPNFGRIAGTTWESDSQYDAMHASFRMRNFRGIEFHTSYTLGKNIDDGSSTFSAREYDNTIANPMPFDPSLHEGRADMDIRHIFSLNFVWEAPTPTWNSVSRWVLGGWQVGGIYSALSGSPFSVLLTADRANTKSSQVREGLGLRPDLVPGCGELTNPGSIDNYINLNCFSFPRAGRLGNLGRNTLEGPGFMSVDFSLVKNHRLRDAGNVQFRAEFFNLLNRPNFSLPGRTSQVLFDAAGNRLAAAGRLTTTDGRSRQIQFGLKFLW